MKKIQYSLLNQVDSNAGKTAYQAYTIKHGIELVKVLVPLKNAPAFEAEFNSSKDKSKAALLEVVTRHSGKIRGV